MSVASVGLLQLKCSELTLTLPVVTALSAILPVVTALSAILLVVTALSVILPVVTAVSAILPVVTALPAILPVVTALPAILPPVTALLAILGLLTAFALICVDPTLFLANFVAAYAAPPRSKNRQIVETTLEYVSVERSLRGTGGPSCLAPGPSLASDWCRASMFHRMATVNHWLGVDTPLQARAGPTRRHPP